MGQLLFFKMSLLTDYELHNSNEFLILSRPPRADSNQIKSSKSNLAHHLANNFSIQACKKAVTGITSSFLQLQR